MNHTSDHAYMRLVRYITPCCDMISAVQNIEDNTWLRGDVKFIFECSTQYRFEHEKINFISPSNQLLFCLFYKPTNNEVFDDFPKISDHFPKISEDFKNVVR